MARCMICHADDRETKHITNLYVIGSEGFNVCHRCEMQLISHINMMRSLASEVQKQTWKRVKKKGE